MLHSLKSHCGNYHIDTAKTAKDYHLLHSIIKVFVNSKQGNKPKIVQAVQQGKLMRHCFKINDGTIAKAAVKTVAKAAIALDLLDVLHLT